MTRPDDELFERLRRAFATFAGEPPAGDCPGADRLWMAVRGELPRHETRSIVLHTSVCPACAEAWRVGYGVIAESDPAGSLQLVRRPAWRSAWVWGPGLAAAALVIISALNNAGISLPRRHEATQLRQRSESGLQAITLDGQVMERNNVQLRWTPGPAGSQYNVRVTTEDLTWLAGASGLTASEYTVPPAALASLPAGTRLLWQVDVFGPDQPRRSSSAFTIRIK